MIPIFDGHNDTLLRLFQGDADPLEAFLAGSDDGHLDLPRARAGGLAGGIFAIFVPPPDGEDAPRDRITNERGEEAQLHRPLSHEVALRATMAMASLLLRLEERAEGRVRIVRRAEDLDACDGDRALAAVLHLEGAEAVDPELRALDVWHAAGVRSLGIVWSRPNAFGSGVPFLRPGHPDFGAGLTDAGRRLVRRAQELGMMLDLSHLNERGFWDVAEMGGAALVASHSAAHALAPSARNLTDAQIDAIGASGGLIGVNFFVGDVRADGAMDPDTPLRRIADHVAYIADRIGVEHVAFGSDFDGAVQSRELGDAAGLQRLVAAISERGFSEEEVRKVAGENWRRILRGALARAR